jgi:hypothetical protein
METKQLNVWIPEEYRNWIADRAEKENCGMNKIVADLIREDIARHNEEFMQDASLIVLQEVLAKELRQTHAQLRQHLRADRAEEREDFWETLKKQFDRLAGLTVNATRNGGIARRLVYILLSKAHGSNFAKEANDYATKKTNEDLTPKPKSLIERYALVEETPAEETSNGHA